MDFQLADFQLTGTGLDSPDSMTPDETTTRSLLGFRHAGKSLIHEQILKDEDLEASPPQAFAMSDHLNMDLLTDSPHMVSDIPLDDVSVFTSGTSTSAASPVLALLDADLLSDDSRPEPDDMQHYSLNEFLSTHGAVSASASASNSPEVKRETRTHMPLDPKKQPTASTAAAATATTTRKFLKKSNGIMDQYAFGRVDDGSNSSVVPSFSNRSTSTSPHIQPLPNSPSPSYLPDFNPDDWASQRCRNLKFGMVVGDFPAKSRVETQIRIALHLYPPPEEPVVHLPTDTISKPKLQLKTPFIPNPNCLMLETVVCCASNLRQYANMCRGCINRERKRASRKKVRLPVEDAHWREEVERRVIVLNCREVVNLGDLEDIEVNGKTVQSKRLELPMRLACYCRHHNERIGFKVFFVLKDFQGKVVARGSSNPVMITDDHKAGGALDSHSSNMSSLNNSAANSAHNTDVNGGNSSDSEQGVSSISIPTNKKRKSMEDIDYSGVNRSIRQVLTMSKLDGASSGESTSQTSPSSHAISPPISIKSEPSTAASSPMFYGEIHNNNATNEGSSSARSSLDSRSVFLSSYINPTTQPQQAPTQQQNTTTYDGGFAVPSISTAVTRQLSASLCAPISGSKTSQSTVSTQILAGSPQHSRTCTPTSYATRSSSYANFEGPLPAIRRVIPGSGPIRGGVEVTLLGSGFVNGLITKFGDNRSVATHCWNSSTIVTQLPPAQLAGPVKVNFEGWASTDAPLFRYYDDTDKQLVELALQVVGLKMHGRLEDARDVARRIIGTNPTCISDLRNRIRSARSSGGMGVNEALSNGTDKLEENLLACIAMVQQDESEYNANYDLCNREKQNMLHLAAILGFDKLCISLLSSAIKVDAKDVNGYTALHFAVVHNHHDVVHLLLRNGSDITSSTYNGEGFMDLCSDSVFANELLEEYGSIAIGSSSSSDGEVDSESESLEDLYATETEATVTRQADSIARRTAGVDMRDFRENIANYFTDIRENVDDFLRATVPDLFGARENDAPPPSYEEIYPDSFSTPTLDYSSAVVDDDYRQFIREPRPEKALASSSSRSSVSETFEQGGIPSDEQIWEQLRNKQRQLSSDRRLFFFWLPVFIFLLVWISTQAVGYLDENTDVTEIRQWIVAVSKGLIGVGNRVREGVPVRQIHRVQQMAVEI